MSRRIFFLSLLLVLPHASASVLFNGHGGLKCGDSGVSLEKSWTLTAWVNSVSDSVLGPYFIVGRTNGGVAAPYAMRLEDDPGGSGKYTVSCEIFDVAGGFTKVYADCGFGDCIGPGGTFYHIACHYSSESAILTPYINGVAFPGVSLSNEMDSTGYDITIGATDAGTEICTDIEVTDVVLYDFEINTIFITDMYTSRMRNGVVPSDYRYGYWPLDDLPDATAIAAEPFLDRSVNANDCAPISDGIGEGYADFLRYK